MPFNPCDPCSCTPPTMDSGAYYQASLITLCNILTALSGGGSDTNVNVAEFGGDIVSLGQKAMAESIPVVIASDQANGATFDGTTPTIANATSVTLLAANPDRRYLLIQNNSDADIMISLSNATLTGITPTSTNIGIVLTPNGHYESPSHVTPISAITVYQTSGASINTVVVYEG